MPSAQEQRGWVVNRVASVPNFGDALCSNVRKALSSGQVGIVVNFGSSVTWVTPQDQTVLQPGVRNEGDLVRALDQKLENPQVFAKFVWSELKSTIVAARVPGRGLHLDHDVYDRRTEVSRSNGQRYKVNVDSYSFTVEKNIEFHAVIALLTPAGSDLDDLSYEQAQLSTIRYNSGLTNFVRGHRDLKPSLSTVHSLLEDEGGLQSLDLPTSSSPSMATVASSEGRKGPEIEYSRSDSPLGDFIPSMSTAEVEYFYSLVPQVSYDGEENNQQRPPSSILEQARKIQDPDDVDPYWKLRQSQTTVNPIRPRKVDQIVEPAQPVHENKCLECGTTKSPEWRKGPLGPKTLCNRCGLRWAKRLKVS